MINPRGKGHRPPPAPKAAAPAAPISGRRKWLFRALLLFSPLILLGALEIVLRLADYGYPTAFFLHRRVNDRDVLINNNQFGWRFFGPEAAREPYPFVMPEKKAPKVIRVFVFGESAAYGDPQPDFGLPRVLAALLRDRFPGVEFEVVNTAMVAINSNVILPQARECARRDGDIWVIYMGNNEVVGPFGGGTVFGPQAPALGVIRANLALKESRTGELLSNLLRRLAAGKNGPAEWRGMMMFINHQVRADDPRMAVVYSHFQQNLRDILAAGVSHGAGIVLSSVASNLKDCAPFGSLHRAGLSAAQLAAWETHYAAGTAREQSSHPGDAIEFYRKAAEMDDSYAELQFRWARCCLALGVDDEARRHFIAARDADTLRFRADTRINEIIQDAAKGRGQERVLIADSAAALAAASPHGLTGREFLYEHVHMNFDGNYLVARTIADQVARLLPESVKSQASPARDWLSATECARRLANTDWARYQGYKLLQTDVPPYTYQLDHPEQARFILDRMKTLAPALRPPALKAEIDECRRAIVSTPGDWTLERILAEMEEQLGDLPAAAQAWERVKDLLPQESQAWFQLGLIAQYAGRTEDAVKMYASAMDIDPVYAQSSFIKLINASALTQIEHGKLDAAIALYRQALGINPNLPEVRLNLGTTLAAQGKAADAQEQFKRALARRPSTPDGLVALGNACHSQGWSPEAISCFEDALHLDRFNGMAHFYLAQELSAANRFADAQPHYAEAGRLMPASAPIQTAWSAALLAQGKTDEALLHAQQALDIDSNDAAAHEQMSAVMAKKSAAK